ncbi:MAG: HD domain-containing protein [Pirellulaceae bacterium]
MTNNRLVEQVEAVVRDRMHGQAAGHGLDHIMRVLVSARTIQSEAGGDRVTVELAALLHDIGDAKFHGGIERSAEFAREILNGLGASKSLTEHVAHIVDNISFRKGVDSRELTIEGRIVQDADRLDALGAIGIVRTIEYGATLGQPFYLPIKTESGNEPVKTGIDHFHDKLFKLKDRLNTDVARRLAEEREAFMRLFLDQFLRESGA